MVWRFWQSARSSQSRNCRPERRRTPRFEPLDRREVMTGNLLSVTGLPAMDNADSSVSIANDAAGNTYVSGSFHGSSPGSFDLDPAHDYPDNHDIIFSNTQSAFETGFIAKYDSQNNFQWVQPAVPSIDGAVSLTKLAIGASGSVYFSGSAYQSFAVGSLTLNGTTTWSSFMGSIDANGNMRWLKALPAGGDFAIDEAHSRVVLASGTTLSAFTLPQDQSSSLNTLWMDTLQANFALRHAVAIDSTGAIIAAGSFTGTVDFDPGPGKLNLSSGSNGKSGPPSAAFVWKLTNDGSLIWADACAGSTSGSTVAASVAADVAVDGNNNIVVAGNFTGPVDVDPGRGTYRLACAGQYDMFLVKLNSSGGFLAAASYGSTRNDNVSDMTLDNSGNVYLVGGDTAPVNGHRQTYLVKYSANLGLIWDQLVVADGGLNRYTSISVSPTGNLNVFGIYTGFLNADSDPDPELNSGDAAFDFFWLQFGA